MRHARFPHLGRPKPSDPVVGGRKEGRRNSKMGGINKGQGEKERQGKKQQQEGIRIG